MLYGFIIITQSRSCPQSWGHKGWPQQSVIRHPCLVGWFFCHKIHFLSVRQTRHASLSPSHPLSPHKCREQEGERVWGSLGGPWRSCSHPEEEDAWSECAYWQNSSLSSCRCCRHPEWEGQCECTEEIHICPIIVRNQLKSTQLLNFMNLFVPSLNFLDISTVYPFLGDEWWSPIWVADWI